jgi:hypothetical protein
VVVEYPYEPLPERDLNRWHINPDMSQTIPVVTWSRRSKKIQTLHWPAMCMEHFTSRTECMWSVRMGPGYPLEAQHRIVRPHWARMEKVNRRWKYRDEQRKGLSK